MWLSWRSQLKVPDTQDLQVSDGQAILSLYCSVLLSFLLFSASILEILPLSSSWQSYVDNKESASQDMVGWVVRLGAEREICAKVQAKSNQDFLSIESHRCLERNLRRNLGQWNLRSG